MKITGRKLTGVMLIASAIMILGVGTHFGIPPITVHNTFDIDGHVVGRDVDPGLPLIPVGILLALGIRRMCFQSQENEKARRSLSGRQVLKHVAWTLTGSLAGGVIGVFVTWALTQLMIVTAPDDPSAGSVAIIIIFFLPVGLLAGGLGGFFWSRWRMKSGMASSNP